VEFVHAKIENQVVNILPKPVEFENIRRLKARLEVQKIN